MIPQTPPRTAKESLIDMGSHLQDIAGLLDGLTRELAAVAKAALPEGRNRSRLVAACEKRPFWDAMSDDYCAVSESGAWGESPPQMAKLLSDAIGSAADIARELKELKALQRQPFTRRAD